MSYTRLAKRDAADSSPKTLVCAMMSRDMPQSAYDHQYGPAVQLDVSGPISSDQLKAILSTDRGVSVEVIRPGIGAGYVFHIEPSGGTFTLKTYAGEVSSVFGSVEELTRFINHASGLEFDEESWLRSEEMNRRIETVESEEEVEESTL